MLDLSARKVYGALAEQCVGGDAKADKVETAVAGHLAGLDSNGNLTDSGVSPTEEVTVEGNPVTFDSPFEQDAKSVVVSVKPIQDLHGYDSPWVGGAGKNKLPLTVANLKALNTTGTWNGNVYSIANGTIEILTDNGGNVTGIKANGTFNANTYFFLLRDHSIDSASLLGHEFILNGCPANGSASTYSLSAYLENITPSDYVDYGSGVTIEYPASYVNNNIAINLMANYTATNLIFAPMLRDSSVSDATFAPYSNECPISGIDEVEIGVSGKNLCEKTFRGFINAYSSGYKDINIDNDSESAVFYAYAGQTYCLSSSITAERNVIGLVSTDNIVSGMPVLDTDSADNNVWTATWTGWTVWYAVPRVSADFEATCQIELGSIPTEYEPYTEHTTTIPLPSTLYGGTVDVTEGSATEECGMVTDDSISNISTGTSGGGMYLSDVPVSANAKIGGNAISSHLPYVSDGNIAWMMQVPCFTTNADGSIRIYIDESTVEGVKARLANLQIDYELATPTTLSFTPTDVELLDGMNVITTNAEKVAVTYGRSLWQDIDDLKTDTEGKLDKSDVATIEGDTASKAYSVNEFMLRSDGLYKVTAPIASGASITASNTIKTTVGEVLTALLNA